MQIPKYLNSYRKELELKNYARNSIDNYCSQVCLFLKHFDGLFTEPAKINERSIKDWLFVFFFCRAICVSLLQIIRYDQLRHYKDCQLSHQQGHQWQCVFTG